MALKVTVPEWKRWRQSYLNELVQLGPQCQWMILCSSEMKLEPEEVEELLQQNISRTPGTELKGDDNLRQRVRRVLWERILHERNSLLKDPETNLNSLVVRWIPLEDREDVLRLLVTSARLNGYPGTRWMALWRGWNECTAKWLKNEEEMALWMRALQDFVGQYPEYAGVLRRKWLKVIQKNREGVAWQSGWLGLCCVGAGKDEDIMAQIAGARLKTDGADGEERFRELTVLAKWRPENPVLRRDLLRQWGELSERRGERIWKWKAALVLEDDEAYLLRQLQELENPWDVLTGPGRWLPHCMEVRRKMKDFCIARLRAGAPEDQVDREVVWETLCFLNPQEPELVQLLKEFLPVEKSARVLEVIASWLEKNELPPGTPVETRHELLEIMQKRLKETGKGEIDREVNDFLRKIAFHLLVSSFEPETEREILEVWQEFCRFAGEPGLGMITWWLKRMNSRKHHAWQRLVWKLWEEQLAGTDRTGKTDALHYLIWMTGEDGEVAIGDRGWECLMEMLARESESIVYLPAILLARHLSRRESSWRWTSLWNTLVGRDREVHLRGVPLSRFFMREFILERVENALSLSFDETICKMPDQLSLLRLIRRLLSVFSTVGVREEDTNHTDSVAQAWNDELCSLVNGLLSACFDPDETSARRLEVEIPKLPERSPEWAHPHQSRNLGPDGVVLQSGMSDE